MASHAWSAVNFRKHKGRGKREEGRGKRCYGLSLFQRSESPEGDNRWCPAGIW